ncbi:TPA: triphosphoribosyl-dephospho-CoA synthase, partial [Enterococcus faecium]|nr:triphosphoribosyl-dephospho-CoA synthase [Enterococcus faecium]
LPNRPFTALLHFCQENQISPGGSADLLSASLFMLKIEELWTADTYICPMLLND